MSAVQRDSRESLVRPDGRAHGRHGRGVPGQMTTVAPASRGAVRRGASASEAKGFRPDVEGLRAVAVGLVLLYHAGLRFVPGGFVGVDVFFVISGFLITGLLVKELERSGTISIAGFYGRRAKRLLPAAALVLAATVVLTFLFLPRIRWAEIGGDVKSAALYVVNWRLANRSVDYLAEDSVASPVQHYWSLAVEEQYYLVWPLLLLLAAWWARRRGRSFGTELWIGLAIIGIPSFVYSIYKTGVDPAVSFFITTTRMWELAIGAAVALGVSSLARLPRTVAIALGWCGLAAIIASALVYSTKSAWPGYSALLPTLGTAGVIAAGSAAGQNGPVRILGTPAFTWIGGLSYSLYLWHWPLIVAASAYWGGLSAAHGLAVAAASVVPAWLTLKIVENPIRFSPTTFKRARNALWLGAALSACGFLVGHTLISATSAITNRDVANAVGARVLGSTPDKYRPASKVDGMVPDPLAATQDVPNAYARGCQAEQDSAKVVSCTYGAPEGKITVALVGDSKALQWISALDTIGNRRGWKVVTYTKSSCSFSAAMVTRQGEPYTTCSEWNTAVLQKLRSSKPDMVLTSQGRATAIDPADPGAGENRDAMVNGLRSRWRQLIATGSTVAVLLDNPNPPTKLRPVYGCVDEHRQALDECAFSRREGERLGARTVQREAAKGLEGVAVVDMVDYLCPGDQCPPVIGNVLIYRQGSHLTKTYVDTLAPRLEKALERIMPPGD
jgi:peptidoglycan/LPS O-acetylase OafA/YrhL